MKNMRSQTFHSVARRFAQVIGRSQGITVTFKGKQAMTNGRHVILPALPPGVTLTPDEAQILGGYLDHEVGHVRFTEFDAIIRRSLQLKKDRVLKHLVNVFEDVREENAYIEEYPGARRYLDRTHVFTDRRTVGELMETGSFKTWSDAALAFVYKQAFEHRGFTDTILPGSLRDMGLEEVAEMIDEGMPRLRDTDDSCELAERVAKKLREIASQMPKSAAAEGEPGDVLLDPEEQEGEPQKGQGQGSGGADEDDQEFPDSSDNEGDSTESSSSQKNDDQTEEKDDDSDGGLSESRGSFSDKEDEKDAEGGKSQNSAPEDPSEDENEGQDGSEDAGADDDPQKGSESPTEASEDEGTQEVVLEQAAEEADDRLDNTKNLDRFLKDLTHDQEEELEAVSDTGADDTPDHFFGNEILPPSPKVEDKVFEEGRENAAMYERVRATCSAEITAMKKMLNTFLRSREAKAWARGLEEGQLDNTALWGMRHGNRRVYKSRRQRTMVNTAVSVMIDCSGSMDEMLTRQAAVILCESLAAIPKVKVMVSGFTTDGYSFGYGGTSRGVGRMEHLRIPIFKKFDESYQNARHRLGAISFPGCTPLGEGYCYGFETLIQREEQRRVLWLITDGEPYYEVGDHRHTDWKLIRRGQLLCRKFGIETVGFGIGRSTNRIGEYTDRYGHAYGFAELQKAILTMLRNTLEQSAKNVVSSS